MLKATFLSTYSSGEVEKSFKGQVPCIPAPGTLVKVPTNVRCNHSDHKMPVEHADYDPKTGKLDIYLANGSAGYDISD